MCSRLWERISRFIAVCAEGKMTDLLVRAAVSGRQVFAVTELLDDDYLLQPEEFEGHIDPHVWNDPKAWMKAVEVIRDSLISFDLAAEQYRLTPSSSWQRLCRCVRRKSLGYDSG